MISNKEFEYFKRGDKKIFKKIFDAFYSSLVFFGRKYSTEPELAEDWVQEVFIMLWQRRETITSLTTIKAYLYTSIRHKAINHYKHQQLIHKYKEEHLRIDADDSFFEKAIIEEETHRLLFEAIEKLPVHTRQVCRLSLQGIQNTQISESLDLSLPNVKYHKKRAVELLKVSLKEQLAVWYLAYSFLQ
ncbi:MAG: sigma-70 family RNA polymerase sigma factor [Cytophagales bacterium]|nr:sigma-70 family RNA polymerase sigma factor [Cytophagales bacterium]